MTPDERKDLANTIFTDLVAAMTADERQSMAARLTADTIPAGEH